MRSACTRYRKRTAKMKSEEFDVFLNKKMDASSILYEMTCLLRFDVMHFGAQLVSFLFQPSRVIFGARESEFQV
jgi:hypothetical protein